MQQDRNIRSGNLRPLSTTDYTIPQDEPDVRGWSVTDSEGRALGRVDELIVDTDAMKVRYLQLRDTDGHGEQYAPIDDADIDSSRKRVVLRSTGSLVSGMAGHMTGADSTADTAARRSSVTSQPEDVQRLTRAEEEVRIGKRAVQTGEVRVGKHVETEHRHQDVNVKREQVHVERRPVTDAHAAAEIRASGEDIRVPITEEEVIVEKRPVIREELIVSKEQVEETRPIDVEVKREEFDVRDNRTTEPRTDLRNDTHLKHGGR